MHWLFAAVGWHTSLHCASWVAVGTHGVQAAEQTVAVVRALVDHLLERTSDMNLTLHPDDSREAICRLVSLVTVLSMNYLYTDRFFEE